MSDIPVDAWPAHQAPRHRAGYPKAPVTTTKTDT